MAFIPLTDEEKRILQNGGAGETEPPDESAGGVFGGINVSSVPQVASARNRLADLRTEAVDAEADLSPAPAADLDSLARSIGIDLSPYEDEPFRGEERLNPAAPGSGMFVELSPKEKALVDGERRFSDSTRFLAGMYKDAQSYDPETYSRNVQASLATRIPVGMMVQDPEVRDEAWRQKMTLDQMDTLEKVGPKLRSWLQIPGRMAAVWDDLPALMALESLVEQETHDRETTLPGRGFRNATAMTESGRIWTTVLFTGKMTDEQRSRLAVLDAEMAKNANKGDGSWDKMLYGAGTMAGQRLPQFSRGAYRGLQYGALAALAAGVLGNMGPQAAFPEEIVTIPGAFGLMARTGFGLGVMEEGFSVEAGLALQEYLGIQDEDGNPLPEEYARIGAFLYGAGASFLETLQMGRIIKAFPGGAAFLSKQAVAEMLKTKTVQTALKDAIKGYGKDLTFEVATEGAQRLWQIIVGEQLRDSAYAERVAQSIRSGVPWSDLPVGEQVQNIAKYSSMPLADIVSDVGVEMWEALHSFALGMMPGQGFSFYADASAAREARKNVDFFKAIGDATAGSKTWKRLSEALGEYATELTKNGPVAEIGIDAKEFSETLMQIGADPEEVAGTLGIAPEDLREAAATGGDVWLPTGVYMEKIAGTELNQALLPDLRLGEGSMTAREAKAFEEERLNRLHEDSEAALKYLEESGAETSDVDYAKSAVRTQLEPLDFKWMGKGERESYAAIFAARAVQAAPAWGISVRDWVDRWNLKVRQGSDGKVTLEAEEIRGQPVNNGVDLSSVAKGTVITPKFINVDAGSFLKGEGRKHLEESVIGEYRNEDTLWDIVLSRRNVSHAISSALSNKDVPLNVSMEVIAELPRILERMRLVESHDDRHQGRHVRKVHRFYSAVQISTEPDSLYKVKLTVKEINEKLEVDVDGVYRAYDAKIIEKAPADPRQGELQELSTDHTTGAFDVILESLLDGVKDSDGNFYLSDNGETRSQSTAALDAEYLAAVEAGDMETAQRMVDEAAKEAGYGIGPVYHGTNSEFNTFDRDKVGKNYGKKTPDHIGFFFTNRKDGDHPGGTAKDWARQSVEKKGGTPVVVGTYIKINNPFTLSDYAASIGDDIETITTYAGDRQPVVDIFDNDSQYILNKAMEMGKDGIVFVDAFEGDSDGLYVAFEPEQIKSADPIVKDDQGNVIPLSQRFDTGVKDLRYQTAYHGSPHRFADFSNEHIGAGEGAQAFGWGLYFADKKEVAEYYRTSVTNRQPTDILIDEASITSLKEKMPSAPFPAMIRAALNGADGDIDRAKEYLLGRKEGNPNLSPNRLKQYDDAINFVESLRGHEIRIERPGPGQIYEVDIPDDNVLLDWDKPLNEQPEAIRKALKTVEGINVKSWLKGNPTGKEVYNQLVSRAQDAGLTIGKNYADDRQAASEILNGVGIKGIRYLDALSRDGSGDSRNYVIWDDKAIAIQQTYYQKGAGGRQYPTQGFINRSDRGITITLTPKANRSTFLHELGHLFLWDLESLVRAGKADSRTAGDWEVVRSWWGGHARDLAEWIAKHGTVSEDVRALFAAPDGAGIVRAALAGKEADAVLADAVRVAAEEYWARGFEQYLFEGVAPSRALRQIFDNFKRWLAKVYKALKGAPDVELSDEVRAVMDRLLASDEEVDQARSLRESERMRNRLIQQGIPTVEADALREAADEAASEAKTKLLAVLLQELGAETREQARKRREAAEPGIREAMRGESAAWKAYDDLLQFADTGYNLAPDERYGEANVRLTSPDGTVSMESAADLLGLDGVEELQALLAEEARSPFEAELNARLDAEVRDLENRASDRETMQSLAEEMLSGEARLRLLALEQAILARKIGDLQFGPEQMEDQPSAWETTAQQARQMSAQVRAYREVAEQLIAGKRVRDARSASRYLAAARKAGREAYELALKGRYEESLAAKDREMMSTALYQASLEARDEMEKAEKHLKKYWGGRKRLRAVIGEEHFAQVMGLTERYGFNGEDELSGDRPHLGDWVAAANAQIGADPNNQGAELPVAKWLITDDYKDRKMSWKDLTVTEFRELVEAVEAIDYFGRSRNKLLAAEREADFAKAKADLEASVTAVHGTLKETPLDPDYRGAGVIGRYLASSDRAEHILRRLDGFKDMAVAWLTFFDPVVKAERAEMKRMREAKSRLETIFSVYSSAERGEMTKKKYTLRQLDPSTGKPLVLSRENVIALLLNWGARENREEVVFGYGFDRTVWNSGKGWIHYGSDEEYWAAFRMGSAEVEKLFSQVLEEKDYEVAQAVWDLNESYWGDIAAMSKKVTGVTPKKVKHLPVTSASGVTYRGGYMTLKFRPESNWDNLVFSEKEYSKTLYAPQGSKAHTKSGHTKERHHGERGKRLLRLDLGVETEHLRDALHDLYFRPVIRDLNNLLADPQVQKTIIGSIGMEAFKQFQPWVNGLANAYRTPSNYGEQMMQKVMGRTSAAILGWSLSSAAKQVFGWFPAVRVLGYKRTALAAFNFWRNPFQWGEMRDFAFEKSEYLRDRVRSFDRDVKAAMEAVTASPVRGKWSAVQETFFLFAGWMDMAVSLPVWTAAWDKAMLEFNGDEAKALEYADFVVRSTQNTGAAKDLAAIQQGSPAWKAMTMFYTAFGSMFQQTREQWFRGHGVRDIPRLAAFALTMYVLPALLEDLMSGRGPEEDEPDDILRWALNSTLQYGASQLILVRDVVNAASSGFSYRMSPMASAGTAAAKVMSDLLKTAEWALGGDEPDWEKIPGHLVEISGPAFGLPSNQIMRTMKAVGRYLDNDPDWSPWDFVITPPKKKGRR